MQCAGWSYLLAFDSYGSNGTILGHACKFQMIQITLTKNQTNSNTRHKKEYKIAFLTADMNDFLWAHHHQAERIHVFVTKLVSSSVDECVSQPEGGVKSIACGGC